MQGLGHVAIDDALGQPLHDRRFTHAGLADQHRVVFGAAAEDLDRAADFFIAANHRIELALAGCGREIPAVFLQGFIGAFWVLIGHVLGSADGLYGFFEFVGVCARLR